MKPLHFIPFRHEQLQTLKKYLVIEKSNRKKKSFREALGAIMKTAMNTK